MKVKIKKSEIIKLFPNESLIYKTLPETIEVEGEVVEEKLCHPRDAKPHIEGIFPKKETSKIEEIRMDYDWRNDKLIQDKINEIIRHINNL